MKLFLLFFVNIALIWNANAADIYIERKHQIHIDGVIRDGDAERVAKLMTQLYLISSFQVKSPGGSVPESLKIASLIDGSKADFIIKQGEICASSCFFLYINGYRRYATAFINDERMQIGLRNGRRYLGVHRPYLGSEDESTAASVAKQSKLMNDVKAYLRHKSIPEYLINEMMSRPSNGIYWLNEKDLEMIGNYDAGVEEILIKECKYSREDWKLPIDEADRKINCYVDLHERVFLPQQIEFIGRLKTGWRPWSSK